ncbi:nucleoprotein TPR-like isoform X2 [Artemia franciscana]|uniref:nucleoprotein TPR-like isoform X2 n=1 Tax=Artemia franciscana TaxID=6661 RepID=UPI0032DA700E
MQKERTTQRASLGAPEGETLLRKIETMTCLQDTNRRLRDELTILQSQFDEVKNKLDTATKELDSLKAKIKEAEDESTQYRSLADSRDQQLKEVTEQTQNSKKTFEKELNILKGEEEAKSAQILSLKSSLDMRMAQIECFEKVKEAIREERQKEVEKLENDLKVANVTMKFLGQKTTDLQNEIKAVKTSADEKDDNYRNEVIAHARSVDAMKLLREEFKEVSKRLVAAEKIAADAKSKEKLIEAKCSVDVQALETRLSELNLVSVSELRKINEILQDQVAKLSEAAEAERNLSVSSTLDEERTNQQLLEVISFLRRDSKMTRTHLERSEAECSQLTAQLKQIRLQLESSEADLKKERTTQRASLGAPEGETLLRKIETMTCLQDTNRRLRDELTILQSQFDEVKNKLDTATKELDSLKEKNRKLNEQFDSISVEATVLRTEIARVKTQSAVFSRGVTERAKFQAEKESLEKSLKSKEAEVARIKNSLDNALKHFESAQKNFDQSKITVEQLNARNEQMKSKMEESDKSRRALQEELNFIRDNLGTTSQELTILKALQEELNSVRDNLGTTSQELTILKADFEKKTQELAKANNTSSQLKAIGRKYKNMYEEIRKQLDEVKKEEPSATAVPVKEETVDETIPKKDGIRRVTTGELFSEPSTTTEGIKQESGKVAELESSLKSVTESRDSLLSQMASLQKELGAMKKENEDLQVHGEKLQKEIDLAKVTTSEKDQLHVTVNDLNQKNKAHLQEIENLSREVSLLRVKVAKLEKDLAESIGNSICF